MRFALLLAVATALCAHPASVQGREAMDQLLSLSRMEETWPWPMDPVLGPTQPPFDPDKANTAWGHSAQFGKLQQTPRGPQETFFFAVNGDAEPGLKPFHLFPPSKKAFKRQLADMQTRGIDFVLQLGDFVTKGTPKNYARFIKFLEANAVKPFFPILGNHDRAGFNPRKTKDSTLYRETFCQKPTHYRCTDFFFDHGGYRFVMLDNADSKLDEGQLQWLGLVLQTELRKIVSLHIPPLALRGKLKKPKAKVSVSVNPIGDESPKRYKRGYFVKGAREFVGLMSKHGVDRVYMGHLHSLAYADLGGVRYVLSGSGGSPTFPFLGYPGSKITHYLLVEAGPGGIRERIITLKGKELAFATPSPMEKQ